MSDEHKAVFAAAAAAAREMRVKKDIERHAVARRLALIDAEIARLDVVISFDTSAPAPAANDEAAPRAERKPKWAALAREVIAAHEPSGIIWTDLLKVMRSPRYGYTHSQAHLKGLIEKREKGGELHRDVERRWHVNGEPVPAPVTGGYAQLVVGEQPLLP